MVVRCESPSRFRMPKRWPEYFDAPEEAWTEVAGSASLGGQVDASSWSTCQVICELTNRIEKLELYIEKLERKLTSKSAWESNDSF